MAMAMEKSSGSKGQAWFCTTGLPSDVVVEVADMSFHLHKAPLILKSRKLYQLIPPGPNQDPEKEIAEEEDEPHHIALPDFPGGPEAFEAAAKFCYGVKIDLTPWNAVPLRCAAEYLDMADDFSDDNLISRTERFLSRSVLRGLRESIQALKSCEGVLPLAEDLGIVRRCIDSIADRASSSDPASLFGWPVTDTNNEDRRRGGGGSGTRSYSYGADSWLDDLAILSLEIYKRVIAAIRAADPRSDVLEGALVSFAWRSIPGLSRSTRKHASAPVATEAEQRDLLETVVFNLPLERSPRGGDIITTKFLFRLLRTANILRASEASRTALERRIALQLEQATVDDLLMPSYSYHATTLYDVDCALRILRYFLGALGAGGGSAITAAEADDGSRERADRLTRLGKLIDGYLGEIASDANLTPENFCDLALALPDDARVYDDGLYRAVDIYIKAHPGMVEAERERVCGVMDCQKLTMEACTHAAQNERLPLRAVVQVLFFEQLQLRQGIAGTLIAAQVAVDPAGERHPPVTAVEGGTWRSAVRENQVMRLDMDSMRSRVQELERECSSMKKEIEKIDREEAVAAPGGWGSLTRRLGCKYKIQVCDSHQRTVVESRRRVPSLLSP